MCISELLLVLILLLQYFEVPHWMNLSFTDYNNEEEPMLYKEHFTDCKSQTYNVFTSKHSFDIRNAEFASLFIRLLPIFFMQTNQYQIRCVLMQHKEKTKLRGVQ